MRRRLRSAETAAAVSARMRARFFSSALWHALRFCGVTLIGQSASAEPRIIFGTPTTGWMPKEKQGGTPLVSLPLRQRETLDAVRSELERPSFGVETFHPLSVASSPILGVCAAAKAAPTSKNRYPDLPRPGGARARALRPAMDVRPLLAQRRAPPRDGANLWRAFGAVALLQFVTLAAVLASRTAPDGRRQLLADELEPPFRKIREDLDLGADERRRLSGALWGLKTVTTATTLTKFMGTMVLCDTSSAAITVTLPAASDMAEQSGASLRHYKFINTGSNDCTIARAGSDTIVTSTLTATFSGGATTSTFTGTAFHARGDGLATDLHGDAVHARRNHLGNYSRWHQRRADVYWSSAHPDVHWRDAANTSTVARRARLTPQRSLAVQSRVR